MLYDIQLMIDDGNRFFSCEQKRRGGSNARGKMAASILVTNEHGLRRLLLRPGLRANIIRRGQGQLMPIPEGCVVTRMIICVATQDVKDNPRKQFAQR